MRQKISPYGNINLSGDPTSPALLLNNRTAGFLEEVEPGIRPVVAAAIAQGIDTYSSCEGHHYPKGLLGTDNWDRVVDLIVDESRADAWQHFVDQLALQHHAPYECHALRAPISPTLLNHPYTSPLRIKIIWPISDPVRADQMTAWLAAALREGNHPPVL